MDEKSLTLSEAVNRIIDLRLTIQRLDTDITLLGRDNAELRDELAQARSENIKLRVENGALRHQVEEYWNRLEAQGRQPQIGVENATDRDNRAD